ncbi:hypothetical protein ACXO77_03785 [Lactobacillus delbrueckii subsp. bulgaricus]
MSTKDQVQGQKVQDGRELLIAEAAFRELNKGVRQGRTGFFLRLLDFHQLLVVFGFIAAQLAGKIPDLVIPLGNRRRVGCLFLRQFVRGWPPAGSPPGGFPG